MNKIKMLIAAVIAVASMCLAALSPIPVNAAVTCPDGTIHANTQKNNLAECNVTGGNTLMSTVQKVINVILSVMGIIAVVMIIIGGIQYTTSSGDPQKATRAKNTILYAIIGLVVALLAFAIVNFVLASVFS